MEINLYMLIAVISALIIISILFVFAVKSKVNLEFSKDKMMVNTSRGQYINSDRMKSLVIELEKLSDIVFRIKTIDIIQEQMKYLERQSITYYRDIQSGLTESERYCKKKNFELHRYKMLDVFRDDVLKKNHFLERENWDSYKKLMFQYCFDRSCEIFADIESGDIDKMLIMDEKQEKELEMLFGKYFYGWMDTFRSITQLYINQIKKIEKQKQAIYKMMGFIVDDISDLEEP